MLKCVALMLSHTRTWHSQGLLGAGISSKNSDAQLTLSDCGNISVAELSTEGRQKLGIAQRMALLCEDVSNKTIVRDRGG